jgi:hypothetical protein
MSYQAPDGWRLPVRAPQHATFGGATPLRIHAHRALRLLAAAGAWAAGLCLVVGSVALVAETAGPAGATHVAPAAGIRRLPPGRLPGDGAARRRGGEPRLAQTFAGTGNQTTGSFPVAPRSRYQLHWSYQCGRRPRGHLLIRESGTAGVTVMAAGPAASGSTWAWAPAAGAARHYLVVIADCAWEIRVTGTR